MAKKTTSRNTKTTKRTTSKVVAKSVPTKKSSLNLQGFNKWNITLAVLHAMQGIAVIVLSKAATLPVTTNYLALDTLMSKAGKPVLAQATSTVTNVNLAYLVASFFFMSAIAHLVIATIYRARYETDLARGINKARWIEYGVSASTMMVAIALLAGIYDLSSLVMIFGLVLVMNLCGLVMELHNQAAKQTNWLSFIVGCVAGILPWIAFLVYVIGSAVYGGAQPPTFVYFILGSLFLLFNCFAVNMFLQYKKIGKWADYAYGERAYMILSLVAKSLLAWQVFFGALRP